MTYVTSYPWGSTEFGISLYESLTEKPLSYSGSSKNNCFFLFIPLRSEPQFPNGPPWSPSMVVNNHATICISSSNRDFLGTKEASLLLMAMFLLAVFYHGQQVIWHFPLTAVDYLAFPIAVKFTWEAVTHLCNKWPLVACSKWWFFFCFVLFFFLWPHCVACRILVSWPGVEPGPRQWRRHVLTTEPPGNSQQAVILKESIPSTHHLIKN